MTASRLTRIFLAAAAIAAIWAVVPDAAQRLPNTVSLDDLKAAIDNLGRLDYEVRMNAARTVRRAPAALAIGALIDAASGHADGYVRYRALVLLSGFNDPRARDIMEESLGDPNDRLRAVAYTYFEHHPDKIVAPLLLKALDREDSEFVRPELTRAVAAYGLFDPKARDASLPLVDRGQDFFRGGMIEALGDYKASYAVEAIERVAKLDGPLQDEAALALGKIGDKRALGTLAELQRSAPRERQPAIAAAICLLGVNCETHQGFITETLRFSVANLGFQGLLRASAASLSAIAVTGHASALAALLDAGVPARDPARAPIALAAGTAAIRNTALALQVLEQRADLDEAVLLLRDAFDMLEEDYEEERFFMAVRRAYWEAPDGSARRKVCDALIQKLDF
jgi:HEAT repeat protein